MRKAVPGYYLTTLKAGFSTGIVDDTCVCLRYLHGRAQRIVQRSRHASLKAIWDNIDKLPPLNPQFQEWTRERAASADVTVPYHPAAVQFYKEKNRGTPKWTKRKKDCWRLIRKMFGSTFAFNGYTNESWN